MIGRSQHIGIVFNYKDGVAQVAQLFKNMD
jgi:hypothetical protein